MNAEEIKTLQAAHDYIRFDRECFFGQVFLKNVRLEVATTLEENGIELCEFGITERARSPAFRIFKGAN